MLKTTSFTIPMADVAVYQAGMSQISISSREYLTFIQNQPDIVDRLLRHIETPSFADLLVRIIQLDEHPSGAGVLEVCSPSYMTTLYRENSSYPKARSGYPRKVS